MADVKVGIRLESNMAGVLSPITVTEITERGFKYRLDEPRSVMPGLTLAIDGHEHFGINGDALYEENAR